MAHVGYTFDVHLQYPVPPPPAFFVGNEGLVVGILGGLNMFHVTMAGRKDPMFAGDVCLNIEKTTFVEGKDHKKSL